MPSASRSRGGFTLFELILVIVLIGVIYGIFINKLTTKSKKDTAAVTLETIGAYLKPYSENAEGDVRFVCLEDCHACDVYAGGKRIDDTTVRLFDRAPAVFKKDALGEWQQVEFLPKVNSEDVQEPVCFEYTLYANGSGSSYIVGYDDVYYLFDAYFRPVSTYPTLEAAQSAYNKTALIPDDERQYDF